MIFSKYILLSISKFFSTKILKDKRIILSIIFHNYEIRFENFFVCKPYFRYIS